jgi:hypothetical protein
VPKVGKRRFPYTEKGIREAMEYAEKTGQALHEEHKARPKPKPKRGSKR